jgi:hypothetical protein
MTNNALVVELGEGQYGIVTGLKPRVHHLLAVQLPLWAPISKGGQVEGQLQGTLMPLQG